MQPNLTLTLLANDPDTLANLTGYMGGVAERDLTFALPSGASLVVRDTRFDQAAPIGTDLQRGLPYGLLLCSFPEERITYAQEEQPASQLGEDIWQGRILDPQWQPPQRGYLSAIANLPGHRWIVVTSPLGIIVLPGSVVDVPLKAGAYLRWESGGELLAAVWSVPQPISIVPPLPAAPWQREAAPAPERQQWLDQQRHIIPDIPLGRYPFAEQTLTRADVEWLLRTHQSAGINGSATGPVDWNVAELRDRPGLDLRGANLRGVDLRGLPLARLVGSLAHDEWLAATPAQREAATVHLEGAHLEDAHLEGAWLRGAHLEGTDMQSATLTSALLRGAHLSRAHFAHAILDYALLSSARLADVDLMDAHLVGTDLILADLQRAYLNRALLDQVNGQGANFAEAHLNGALITHSFFYQAHMGVADLTDAQVIDTDLKIAGR